LLPDDGVPVVAALGAIGPDKGARRIEHLIELIGERQIALRIVVIGYLDVQQGPWQSEDARLTVHGRYDSRDLPALLQHYRARLVLFPSAGPETFSYTLSEAWRAGMPALVPPIGALAERVSASGAGWVLTDDEWRDDVRMLDRLVALAGDGARDARAHAAANARAVTHASPQQMADATLAHYDAAVAGRPAHPARARFTNLRIRDALGYHAWTPPEPTSAESDDLLEPRMAAHEETGWMARFARRALAIRRTPMGRVLYRMTPAPVIDALKARLDG
jgi:hypothetical protein